MIDEARLARQRAAIEALRVATERDAAEAARLEAANARRRAELDAVALGLRVECIRGCGRPVSRRSVTNVCTRCQGTEWQRQKRRGLRLVASAGSAE